MSITNFIKSFLNRKGAHVLFSFGLTKVVNFVVAIVVVNLLTQSEYGYVAYALTIVSFILPFMGAGIHQGLLRYGALSESQIGKRHLFRVAMKKGMWYSFLLVGLVILLLPFISSNLKGSAVFLAVLSFQLIALLLLQFVEIYCRLLHLNKLFAQIEISNSLLLLVGNIGMAYFFGAIGYVLSLALVPFLVACYYIVRLKLFASDGSHKKAQLPIRKFVSYGMSVSMAGVLSQLLFAVDIMMIGNVIEGSEDYVASLVAQYKVASIIPFSFLMIPLAMLTTDFVKLSRASEVDKPYLKNYYLNYLKLFFWISLGLFIFFYFLGNPLLGIFGSEYKNTPPDLIVIFAMAIVGGLLFRVPLGNILSAIGWPKVNLLFSAIVLVINVVANYFMVKWYGIRGAALTTCFLMWFSGLLSLGAFVYYLSSKKQTINSKEN